MKLISQSFRNFIVLLFIVGGLISCSSRGQKKSKPDEVSSEKTNILVETFRSNDGWGYEIKVNEKTKIKQLYIPAISGNLPFDSEMEARRVGELVAKKMKRHGLPTITKNDLDSLQIRY